MDSYDPYTATIDARIRARRSRQDHCICNPNHCFESCAECNPPKSKPVSITPNAKPQRNMTLIRAFWLWFRFVLLVAGILCLAGIVAYGLAYILMLFNTGDWLLALEILSIVASLVVGTWIYVYQRGMKPDKYQR